MIFLAGDVGHQAVVALICRSSAQVSAVIPPSDMSRTQDEAKGSDYLTHKIKFVLQANRIVNDCKADSASSRHSA